MGGWVLDLGDGGDAIRVEFVNVFNGLFFSSWESKACWGVCFYTSSRGACCIGKSLIGGIYEYFVFFLLVNHGASNGWLRECLVEKFENVLWPSVFSGDMCWLIFGRLVTISLGCWVWIIIIFCLCNVCSPVRTMLCRCRNP